MQVHIKIAFKWCMKENDEKKTKRREDRTQLDPSSVFFYFAFLRVLFFPTFRQQFLKSPFANFGGMNRVTKNL